MPKNKKRNTQSWKHIRKDRKQYYKCWIDEFYGIYDPYFCPMSYAGLNKRNTPFMDTSDIDD